MLISCLTILVFAGAANPVGYVANLKGTATYAPTQGQKRSLTVADLKRAVRLYPGDKIALNDKAATVSMVVYGRRVRKDGVTNYVVPTTDPRVGEMASRAAIAGRGASGGESSSPDPLAIFAHHNLKEFPVGNLIPLQDGSLPLVWIAHEKQERLKITLTIGETAPKSIWVAASEGGLKGYPFGLMASRDLGEHLTASASDILALPATLEILGDDGSSSRTAWEVPKKSHLEEGIARQKQFDLSDFDGFDQAVSLCEGSFGEATRLPTYPLMRSFLVVRRWRQSPDEWARLSMVHLLTLEFRFDEIELKLKKLLVSKDSTTP